MDPQSNKKQNPLFLKSNDNNTNEKEKSILIDKNDINRSKYHEMSMSKKVHFGNKVVNVIPVESYKKFNTKTEENHKDNLGCSVCQFIWANQNQFQNENSRIVFEVSNPVKDSIIC